MEYDKETKIDRENRQEKKDKTIEKPNGGAICRAQEKLTLVMQKQWKYRKTERGRHLSRRRETNRKE